MDKKYTENETIRVQVQGYALSADELELYDLAKLAGVKLNPRVFKIILDLLRMNVTPVAIMQMLKLMCDSRQQQISTTIHSQIPTSQDNDCFQSRQLTAHYSASTSDISS